MQEGSRFIPRVEADLCVLFGASRTFFLNFRFRWRSLLIVAEKTNVCRELLTSSGDLPASFVTENSTSSVSLAKCQWPLTSTCWKASRVAHGQAEDTIKLFEMPRLNHPVRFVEDKKLQVLDLLRQRIVLFSHKAWERRASMNLEPLVEDPTNGLEWRPKRPHHG